MAGKKRSAKGARITVGGTALNWSEWDATVKGDDLDTTCFEDGGHETGVIGIDVVEYSVKGDWDAGRNAFDSPPGLYPRDDLSTVRLYENVSDNIFWAFATSRVLSARNGAQVRGLVSFEASCKSNGSYTLPTGSV